MKALIIMYSGADRHRVPGVLDQHTVAGYTELTRAHGAGITGRREETRAWPGDTTVYFSVMDDSRIPEILAALRADAAALPPGERLHVAMVPVEQFF
ncbi:MAG: hypothetical protein AB7I33_15485 [Gemmatimonadales bacterium]